MKKFILLLFGILALAARLPAQSNAIAGNLNAATTTCLVSNSCLILSVAQNDGGATIKLSGTWSATVQFEATADPLSVLPTAASWVALSATPSNSATTATSATANGAWQVNISGYQRIRIRISAFTSGTVAGAINLSTASARGGSGGGAGGTVTGTGAATDIAVWDSATDITGSASLTSPGPGRVAQIAPSGATVVRGITQTGSPNFVYTETASAFVAGDYYINYSPDAGTHQGFFEFIASGQPGDVEIGTIGAAFAYVTAFDTDVDGAGTTSVLHADGKAFNVKAAGAPGNLCVLGNTSGTSCLTTTATSTTLSASKGFIAPTYSTTTNCADGAGAAACGSAAAGSFVIDAGASTVVVSTSAVTANSEIFVQYDSSLGTRLGSITCNVTVALPSVTARTAGASFTVTVPAAPIANPACYSFHIIN